jgi:hypothetical protein
LGRPVEVKLVWAVLLGVAVGSCDALASPSYTHKMKVTIDVVRDGVNYSGSGVIEITWNTQIPLTTAWNCVVLGDAIMVDVASLKVIAILRQFEPDRVGICHMALSAYGFGVQPSHENVSQLASKKGPAQVPERALPTLVTFVREDDPKSATVISASYGIQLRGVTVEMTGDPITRGVINSLPAVQRLIDEYKGKDTYRARRHGYEATKSDFVRGE